MVGLDADAIGLGGRCGAMFVGLAICPTGGLDEVIDVVACVIDGDDVLLGPAPGVEVLPLAGATLPPGGA